MVNALRKCFVLLIKKISRPLVDFTVTLSRSASFFRGGRQQRLVSFGGGAFISLTMNEPIRAKWGIDVFLFVSLFLGKLTQLQSFQPPNQY